jgi:predicted peptidase
MRVRFIFFLLILLATRCKKSVTKEITPEPAYETLPAILSPVTANINGVVGGYYQALPVKYDRSGHKYPLLLFVHGGGQFGNGSLDLPVILNEGVPQLLDEKIFPPDFEVEGTHFSFVVLAPQFRQQPAVADVYSFISYALENYRVDSSRIYLVGMSNGGRIVCNVAAAYPSLLAAIVPIAGVPDSSGLEDKTSRIAESNLPIWIFHNDSDEVINITLPLRFIESLANHHPAIVPRFTEFEQPMGLLGHDAWTRATNPQYKEAGKNIYEWMLSYHR